MESFSQRILAVERLMGNPHLSTVVNGNGRKIKLFPAKLYCDIQKKFTWGVIKSFILLSAIWVYVHFKLKHSKLIAENLNLVIINNHHSNHCVRIRAWYVKHVFRPFSLTFKDILKFLNATNVSTDCLKTPKLFLRKHHASYLRKANGISSNKHPRHLLNFEENLCSVCERKTFIKQPKHCVWNAFEMFHKV